MWLIVGLGNPGNEYKMTRHNIGFMCLDVFSDKASSKWKSEHKAETLRGEFKGEPVLLAKPQTFMNLSGESVVSLMNFYKISKEKLLVIHDELEFPFQKFKFQKNRGHGGHNGVKSISGLLGTADYTRLKLGIGRPANPNQNVADYVLQKFSSEEFEHLSNYLNTACDAVEYFMQEGLQKASTKYN